MDHILKQRLFEGLLRWNETGDGGELVNQAAKAALREARKTGLAASSMGFPLLFRGRTGSGFAYGVFFERTDDDHVWIGGLREKARISPGSLTCWTGYVDMMENPIFWGDEVAIIGSRFCRLDNEAEVYSLEDDFHAEIEELIDMVPQWRPGLEWYCDKEGGTICLPYLEYVDRVKKHKEDPHLWLEHEDYGLEGEELVSPDTVIVLPQ